MAGLIALFLVLSGGTALANHGFPNTISSEDIIDAEVQDQDLAPDSVDSFKIANNQVRTEDIQNGGVRIDDIRSSAVASSELVTGGVAGIDIMDGAVASVDVAANSLTGADIDEANVSGLDRCPTGATRLGRLCARSDGTNRNWDNAMVHCASLALRLPTLGEALTLAINNDVPGVGSTGAFWTDGVVDFIGDRTAWVVADNGIHADPSTSNSNETVCVVPPFN
jgi:hypothetical protein